MNPILLSSLAIAGIKMIKYGFSPTVHWWEVAEEKSASVAEASPIAEEIRKRSEAKQEERKFEAEEKKNSSQYDWIEI